MNTTSKSKNRSLWVQAGLFGIIFECVLIGELFADNKQGSFFIELYNLATASHYPFFWFADFFRVESNILGIIWLIIYEFVTVLVWTPGFYWIRQSVMRRLA